MRALTRDQIFHTSGPLAGTEDRFPGPDNVSKMRRSIENAEHVGQSSWHLFCSHQFRTDVLCSGLFAPRMCGLTREDRRAALCLDLGAITAAERDSAYPQTCVPRRPSAELPEPTRSAPSTYPPERVFEPTTVVFRGPRSS